MSQRKIIHETETDMKELGNCRLCPRECNADRFNGPYGYCNTGSGYYISSIVIHMGEEPLISGLNGIANIFFSHCNLQCIYCQNYQISRNKCVNAGRDWSLSEILDSLIPMFQSGIENVGFVSPSHMVPQMKKIIKAVNDEGYHPVIVYNTNAYDKVETLKSLEDIVDVYLPDLKYDDPLIAKKWSDAADYPEKARMAVKEMYRQKGNTLHINTNGKLDKGLVIRHLVLPGETENSINVLKFLAEELSNRIAVSLMSQYYPPLPVSGIYPLNRKITRQEYMKVVEYMEDLGFSRGWTQDPESSDFYNPDFSSSSPFSF